MIELAYVQSLARYNAWQNRSVYAAADTLTAAERLEERGAFFGSIQGTLNHILWGDRTWMSRLAGWEPPSVKSIPESPLYFQNWDDLKRERVISDGAFIAWANTLHSSALDGDLTWYSGAAGRDVTKPKWMLVTHLFNHQTHHRGQVNCLLTQFGARPAATDLAFMPE